MSERKYPLSLVAVLLIVIIVLAGVAVYYATKPTPTPPPPTKKLRVAGILPGPIHDGGWNTIGYMGLTAIEEKTGAEITYSEYVSMADADRVAREYIAEGYDVILFHGGEYTSIGLSIAKEFPDKTFILIGSGKIPDIPPNLWLFYQTSYNVGYYLCGRLAAMITKTNVIGWVGGMDLPHGVKGYEYYVKGAKDEKPGIEVLPPIWLGDFNDPVKARDATQALIAKKADVIYAWVDLGFYGVVEAVKAAPMHVWTMGINLDRHHADPEHVVTSVVTDYRIAYVDIVKQIMEGKRGGYYGMEFGNAVYLAPFYGLVPSEVETKMKAIEEDIKAGKIEIEDLVLPK